MVVNVAELMEAVGAIEHYSTLFDQEQKMKENRKNTQRIVVSPEAFDEIEEELKNPSPPTQHLLKAAARHKAKFAKEDEGALILEAQTRTGPTASELALEKQMGMMQGESLVFKEK